MPTLHTEREDSSITYRNRRNGFVCAIKQTHRYCVRGLRSFEYFQDNDYNDYSDGKSLCPSDEGLSDDGDDEEWEDFDDTPGGRVLRALRELPGICEYHRFLISISGLKGFPTGVTVVVCRVVVYLCMRLGISRGG